MRRSALSLLLLTAACPGNDICTPTGLVPDTTAFGLTGAPVTLPLTLPVECGARMPSSVTVSVLGPSDERVDAGSDAPAPDLKLGFTTHVTFTPTAPGDYHVSARFEPNLGLAQFDLIAAADRRDAGAALVVAASDVAGCTHVEVTQGGQLVCIATSASEYADNVLWSFEGGVLTRYVERDGGFAAAGSMLTGQPDQLLPTANDVLVIGAAPMLVTADDGGLDTRALTMLPISPVQWRDDKVFGALNGNSLCTQPLDGGTTPPPCAKLSAFTPGLSTIGVDTGGFWATEMTLGTTTFVYHVTPDGSAALKLPSGWSPVVGSASWESAARVKDDGGTQLVLNDDIGLEAYAGPGERITHACTHFVVVESGSTARVVRR